MNIFDLTTISSVGESFPNVVPESMLMEIPVVSTRVGDISNVINKKSGWICDPNDSEALKFKIEDAINEFQNDKKRWLERKSICRKKIENFFSINEMINNYENLWSEVINDQSFSPNNSSKRSFDFCDNWSDVSSIVTAFLIFSTFFSTLISSTI